MNLVIEQGEGLRAFDLLTVIPSNRRTIEPSNSRTIEPLSSFKHSDWPGQPVPVNPVIRYIPAAE